MEFQISGPSNRKQSPAFPGTIPHLPMLIVLVVVLAQYPHLHVVRSDCETGTHLNGDSFVDISRECSGSTYEVPLLVIIYSRINQGKVSGITGVSFERRGKQ